MKLADLLSGLGAEELERLTHEHVRTDEPLSRHATLNMIEGGLRSFRFVQEFISNRQPPTFAILLLLLEAPGHALPTSGFREKVVEETQRIADLVSRGEILGRDDQLRLYRRVLSEARRNDLVLDPSESAVLGVLRRELGIAQVEHFLIEHHAEIQEFWNKDHAFLHEVNALRSGGLVFVHDGATMLAEDLAPLVRRVVGLDMDRAAARRFFARLGGQELYDALLAIQVKTSGAKDDRIERLIQHMVQPRAVARQLGLAMLRDLCRDTGANVSGAKDELADRLVQHFATGRDLTPDEPPPPPVVEERVLDQRHFGLLFESLRGAELGDILQAFPELRQSGTKEVRVATLWEAKRSEETLLGVLRNRDLEAILERLGMRLSGSKSERIGRIVHHFANASPENTSGAVDHSAAAERLPASEPSSST
jgi:hypothetical protein